MLLLLSYSILKILHVTIKFLMIQRLLTWLGGTSAWYPASGLRIHLVHLVVLNGCATVVLGSLPLQLASLLVHVRYLQRSLRRCRLICHCYLHRDWVFSWRIACRNGVIAAVVSRYRPYAKLGVVVAVVDLYLSVGVQRYRAVTPFDVRRRLTDHVSVEFEHRAGGEGDVPQIAPIDLRGHCDEWLSAIRCQYQLINEHANYYCIKIIFGTCIRFVARTHGCCL